ncbi:hypothetical protein SAMN05421857_1264 [Chryseobacterium formosense]|nr:hypothetical protein SAMN05421857_1264 [Chryseobacterium formosense]
MHSKYALSHNLIVLTTITLHTPKEIFMKFIITSIIVVTFTVSSCKKDKSTNASNNSDSVSASDNKSIPTNNSSSISTDSLNKQSQNAAIQNIPSADSAQRTESNSQATKR